MRQLNYLITTLASLQSFPAVTATQKIFSRPDESVRDPFTPAIDDFAHAAIQQWLVPGMAIAVVSNEETSFQVSKHPTSLIDSI